MGDPSGIGPEIAIKAILSPEINRICRPVLIGDSSVLKIYLKTINAPSMLIINEVKKVSHGNFQIGFINILDMGMILPSKLKIGKVTAESGKASLAYIEKAIDCALDGKADAIVTGPINKEAIKKAGSKFSGHTELLAHKTKAKSHSMMFLSDAIRIALVTTHIPLADVPKNIDKKRIVDIIKLADKEMTTLLGKRPKIGVAALNPHAGENGILGTEELKIIEPAVNEAKKTGINVKGPISADIIFHMANIGAFDIIVSMYHDQALIPVKLLAFHKSVNFTAGLPIIRTSVDHGTAFDIAGKNYANPSSMLQAIKTATLMAIKK